MSGKKNSLGRSRPSKGTRFQCASQTRQNINNEPCQGNVDNAAVMPPTWALHPPAESVDQVALEQADQLQSHLTDSCVDATTPISAKTPISRYNSSSYTYQVSDTSPVTIPKSFINSPNPESWRGLQDTLKYPPSTDVLNDENSYVLQGVGGQGHLSGEHTMRLRQGEMLDRSPPGYLSNLPMFELQSGTPSLMENDQVSGSEVSWSAQRPRYVPSSTVDLYAPEAGEYEIPIFASVGAGTMADDFMLYEGSQCLQPVPGEHGPHKLMATLTQDEESRLLEHVQLGDHLRSEVPSASHNPRFGGRRSGSHLAEEKRKRSNDVKRARACFRCHTLRIQCSTGGTCDECERTRKSLRTFPFSCDRDLSERWVLMIPGILTHHLGRDQIQLLVNQSMHRLLGEGFELALTFGFGPDVIFEGRWYEPTSPECSIGVRIDDFGKSQLTREVTPPITPYWVRTGDVKRTVNSWLEAIIGSRLENWVSDFFREYRDTLQRELLKVVCRFYYHTSGHSPSTTSARSQISGCNLVLKKALKLLILEVAMGHQICIPIHAQEAIQRRFPDQPIFPSDPTSPRLVNRVLKSNMVFMMQYLAKEVISGMEDIWRARGHYAWTECVCVMIVLLTAVAGVQVSLVDWSQVVIARDENADVSAMSPALQDMEEYFCKHFISLFHARFKTFNSRNPFNPFISRSTAEPLGPATRSFVEDISSAFQNHSPFPNGAPDLSTIEHYELGKNNIPRLLSYFLSLFFIEGGGDGVCSTVR